MPEIRYADALRQALSQAMEADERVFLLGEDIGVYEGAFGVTQGLLERFGPRRVLDTPIAEEGILGTAVGAALTGLRPVAEMQFLDFISHAMEQLCNQAGKIRFMFGGKAEVPLVVRLPGGSGTGAAAQHSQSLEAWFTHMPGLKVVMPATPYDAKGLLLAAIDDPNPVVFVEHKKLYFTRGEVPDEPYRIHLGRADVKRRGEDLTIVPLGVMVVRALEAAEQLAQEGIEVEIVDPRTLKPYDEATVNGSVARTGRALVVYEAYRNTGFGAEIAARIAEGPAFGHLKAPVRRLAGLDVPIPRALNLERLATPQVEDIVTAAREMVRDIWPEESESWRARLAPWDRLRAEA